MRKICGYLEKLFEFLCPNLIAHQRQRDRQREGNQNRVKADDNRIPDCESELIGIEILNEVIQSHPFAAPDSFCRSKILKRNNHSVHRIVGKQQENNDGRQHQQIQRPAFLHTGDKALLVFSHIIPSFP